MPWDKILVGVSGATAVVAVLVVLFLKAAVEKSVEAAGKRFESALKRAEEFHRSTLAFAAAVDTDLRQRRIPVYAELWEKTGILPKWPRDPQLTYERLRNLTAEFRDWYFKEGGMYLSQGAREGYGNLQDSLSEVLKPEMVGVVSDKDYEAVREKCSALRTELTKDLLSRREAPEI